MASLQGGRKLTRFRSGTIKLKSAYKFSSQVDMEGTIDPAGEPLSLYVWPSVVAWGAHSFTCKWLGVAGVCSVVTTFKPERYTSFLVTLYSQARLESEYEGPNGTLKRM